MMRAEFHTHLKELTDAFRNGKPLTKDQAENMFHYMSSMPSHAWAAIVKNRVRSSKWTQSNFPSIDDLQSDYREWKKQNPQFDFDTTHYS